MEMEKCEFNHLEWFIDNYRAMIPIGELLQVLKKEYNRDSYWLSTSFQEQLINSVICNDYSERFPPQKQYIRKFLTLYMNEIEKANMEVCETLYREFMAHVKRAEYEITADALHYLTYTYYPSSSNTPSASTDPIEKSLNMHVICRVANVSNEVGLQLWEAGAFLTEFAIAYPNLFANKTILELGAGVGLTSIVLAMQRDINLAPRHIIVSDYAQLVLQNLHHNVEMNREMFGFNCAVQVLSLDWETWGLQGNDDTSMSYSPDVIIAGDCVYDIKVIPTLVRLVGHLLEQEHETNSAQKVAYFASTLRNIKTFTVFIDEIKKLGIHCEDITEDGLKAKQSMTHRYANRDRIYLTKLTYEK